MKALLIIIPICAGVLMLTCLITVAAIRLKYDVLQYVFFLIFYIIKTAITWLKYCRYGVKQYSINQSINQSLDLLQEKIIFPV